MTTEALATRTGSGRTSRVCIAHGALYDLYVVRQLSTVEIGRLLGCSKKTVRLRLAEHGISRRSLTEAFRVSTTHQTAVRRNGAEHGSWRGGTRMKTGYRMVMVKSHPEADAGGYVFEHRLVMERVLGRRLLPGEEVHHINEDRTDNRPENLTVMTKREHMSKHLRERHAAGKMRSKS